MKDLEKFFNWFFKENMYGMDRENGCLLIAKDGKWVDAYEEYKINENKKVGGLSNLEKIFFYHCLFSYCINPYGTIREIVDMYIKIGIPQKQLLYYLEKWVKKGFYDYGTNIACGWFYVKHIKGIEYGNIANIIFNLLDDEIKKALENQQKDFY